MTEKLMGREWYELLQDELNEEYIKEIKRSLPLQKFYPQTLDIFKAYELTPPSSVKVVIVGQDPYHNGHAHGLAFSSLQETTPASLRTIFKEIDRSILKSRDASEFKSYFPTNNLTKWAQQGVFLINPILTVKPGVALSHESLGWQDLTGRSVLELYRDDKPKVFMLWGKKAQEFFDKYFRFGYGTPRPHLVLKTGHPATASYGKDQFTGCNHFQIANTFLQEAGREPITWDLR